MLELIRRYSHSPLIKALLTILAFTFVIYFGVSDVIRKIFGKDYIVKVGSIKITPDAFRQEKNRTISMMRSRVKNIDEKAESSKILYQMIWESIINLAAADFGLSVSDHVIEQYIGTAWKFKDEKGNFSANLLRGFLKKVDIPEQMFIDFSRKDIKKALINEPFKYLSPYDELDLFMRADKEKRILTILELNPASFPVLEKPTEEELDEFRTSNPELFETKETRSFRILKINESDIEKEIKITEDELKEAYEFSLDKDEKTFDEMKDELRTSLKDEKLESKLNDMTRQIEDSLIGGESVESVCEKFAISPIKYENVNDENKSEGKSEVIKESYAKDVLSVAFSIDEGTDSTFFEVAEEKGARLFLLVHVDKIEPKHVEELSKISKKVKKEWLSSKQKEKALALAREFVEKSKESQENLMTFAAKNGRIATTSKAFNREGEIDDKKAKKDPIIEQIHKNAFGLEKLQAAYEECNGKIVVYQLKKIVPVDDVMTDREKYAKQLVEQRTEDMYQQMINHLSKRYNMKVNYDVLKEVDDSFAEKHLNFDDLFN